MSETIKTHGEVMTVLRKAFYQFNLAKLPDYEVLQMEKRFWVVYAREGISLEDGPLLGVYPEEMYRTDEVIKVPKRDCAAHVKTESELTDEERAMLALGSH